MINLSSMVGYKTEIEDSTVLITLDVSNQGIGSSASVAQQPSTSSMTNEEAEAASASGGSYDVANIDFRRGDAGEGRILVTLGNPAIPVDVREQGGKIIMEIFKATIDNALVQSLDVMDFATPVSKIETKPVGENVVIEISPTGEYDYLAYQANEVFAVEVRSLTKQEKDALLKERLVFTG
ncbi:MAG: type IV pilus secretin PilQ, partial [Candidatus Thiodiazotropha taylori]|nr:type IV pilus secretin PilQ [Candidatus Thiodiazotropha taylori]